MTGSINGQINYTISDDQMHISGTAYLEGQSGFDQNTYIQIVDKETGEYVLYDTLAVCDGTKKYGDEGYLHGLRQASACLNFTAHTITFI